MVAVMTIPACMVLLTEQFADNFKGAVPGEGARMVERTRAQSLSQTWRNKVEKSQRVGFHSNLTKNGLGPLKKCGSTGGKAWRFPRNWGGHVVSLRYGFDPFRFGAKTRIQDAQGESAAFRDQFFRPWA